MTDNPKFEVGHLAGQWSLGKNMGERMKNTWPITLSVKIFWWPNEKQVTDYIVIPIPPIFGFQMNNGINQISPITDQLEISTREARQFYSICEHKNKTC